MPTRFPAALAVFCLSLAAVSRAQTLEEAQGVAGKLLADRPTALQKHVLFFDKDANGLITRAETERGLRELGMGRAKASGTAWAINLLLGPKTSGSWKNLDISVANIKLGKHGSDSGAFDADGRFVPEAFERMFAEFDANRSNSLSALELETMIEANSKIRPGEKFASEQEFQLLLLLASDTTETAGDATAKAITKERLRQFYDGSLFYALAKPLS